MSENDQETIREAMRLLSRRRTAEQKKGRPNVKWKCPMDCCGMELPSTSEFRFHLRSVHDVHWNCVMKGGRLLPENVRNVRIEKVKSKRKGGEVECDGETKIILASN